MKLIIFCFPLMVAITIDGIPVESEGSGDTVDNIESQTLAAVEEDKGVTSATKPTSPDAFKPDSIAAITNYHSNIDHAEGNYNYGFVSSNGIEIEETGGRKELSVDKESGNPVFGTQSSGRYSYVHDNVKITVTWKADENGFQPKVEFTTL